MPTAPPYAPHPDGRTPGLYAAVDLPAGARLGLYEGVRVLSDPAPAGALAIPATKSRPAYWVKGTGPLAALRTGGGGPALPFPNLYALRARGVREGQGWFLVTSSAVRAGEELVIQGGEVVY